MPTVYSKNGLFGTVKLVRNAIESKFTYNGRQIAFDGQVSWSFNYGIARNVIIFCVDNTSSSHTNNRKNNFLVLAEGQTDDINDSTGAAEKRISINFIEADTNFCLSLQYNNNGSYLYVNKTELSKSKAKNNISWFNFCLGSISKDFTKDEKSGISLNGTVYDFSFDHSLI